jgi:hypothetical protein
MATSEAGESMRRVYQKIGIVPGRALYARAPGIRRPWVADMLVRAAVFTVTAPASRAWPGKGDAANRSLTPARIDAVI